MSRGPQNVQIWLFIVAKKITKRIVFTVFAYFPLRKVPLSFMPPVKWRSYILQPCGILLQVCRQLLVRTSSLRVSDVFFWEAATFACCPRALWDQEHCVDSVYIYLLSKAGTLNICVCQMLISKHTNTQVVKLCALKKALN